MGTAAAVVVYRRHVKHETAKNFQLDLFDPSDGHYEYSAVVTNKGLGGQALWAFICGRGIHEKIYGELKSGFAFDSVPTMRYAANSAWQLLSVLAFNLMRTFKWRPPLSVDRRLESAVLCTASRRSTVCVTSFSTVPGPSCGPMATRLSMSGAHRLSSIASNDSIVS